MTTLSLTRAELNELVYVLGKCSMAQADTMGYDFRTTFSVFAKASEALTGADKARLKENLEANLTAIDKARAKSYTRGSDKDCELRATGSHWENGILYLPKNDL